MGRLANQSHPGGVTGHGKSYGMIFQPQFGDLLPLFRGGTNIVNPNPPFEVQNQIQKWLLLL